MTVYLIARHAGAVEWIGRQGIRVEATLPHLDINLVQAGDRVIGSLPVHLAAEVCARGGRYLHLSMDLPLEQRGVELTADDMDAAGARLEEFRVERVSGPEEPNHE
jgi:CRISPR-associated protein Csx16